MKYGMVRAIRLDRLASFGLIKFDSYHAHQLGLEWTRRMQWLHDIYLEHSDDVFEY